MAVNLGTIYAELGLRMDKFTQGANLATTKINALEDRMQSTEEASKMLASGMLAVGSALGVVGGYAIMLAAQMEQSEIAFGTLLGSGEKAEAFLRDLSQFAAKTPFEMPGLMRGSRMLLAFGFQAKEIIPMMTAVGDSVAALGGGEFEIQRVVRALGQMRARGRVSGQEMMQLAELGIPVWEILAKEIGVSIPEAMRLASQGAIDGMTGVNALLAGMGGRFEGAMEAQSKTIIGMWSTIRDSVNLAAISMGNTLVAALDISKHAQQAIIALDEVRITMEAFEKVATERGIRAAIIDLFGPQTTTAILSVAGAIVGGLVPAIGVATRALWLKFAAVASLKPWMMAGAVAGTLLATRFIIQAEATRGSTKSLQDHIAELRRQAGATRASGVQTDRFRTSLQRVGAQARQTGASVADAATLAQDRIRAATSRVDRLHDALFQALRRKYEKDRDAAMRTIDQQFEARRNAINAQLDLLDETGRREDFHADRAEKVTELAMLRREAGYEVDARRRAAIMNRITEIEKDLAEGQLRFDRDTRRRGLQEQLDTLRTEEDTAKTSAAALWEGRLSEARLGALTEQLIIRGNQEEILALLRGYGDGWRDIGVTFGQRLIEGMGPHTVELSRMVQIALADARAAADGTIERLRRVATAAAAVAAAPAPVIAVPGAAAGTAARVGRAAPAAGVGDLRQAMRGPALTPDAMVPTHRPLRPALTPDAMIPTHRPLQQPTPLQEFLRELRQGFSALFGTGPNRRPQGMGDLRRAEAAITHTGPLVNIQTMSVRSEDDIRRVSQQLQRSLQPQTRARGGR